MNLNYFNTCKQFDEIFADRAEDRFNHISDDDDFKDNVKQYIIEQAIAELEKDEFYDDDFKEYFKEWFHI